MDIRNVKKQSNEVCTFFLYRFTLQIKTLNPVMNTDILIIICYLKESIESLTVNITAIAFLCTLHI